MKKVNLKSCTFTHNGAKSVFSEHFVRTGKISKENGKVYSQLFTWRQKGDYDDLFDFDREKVTPYIEKDKVNNFVLTRILKTIN